ncbi:unnamed protein product [Linum tenue]|uniref:Uncharacterized protein n=1 Tax=Linum tenue TaxID=586396 RepID=A0AAV0L5N5_9ROSI|nr:unnamed protein product [Linum tenue]
MYFKGDHDLKAQIKIVLKNLLEKTNATSKESDIRSTFEYPSYDPHIYGSAFCEQSKTKDCRSVSGRPKKCFFVGVTTAPELSSTPSSVS